ncbi:MAG: SpoIIE family protein phosphatase [Crocinitomicaceae bacterium]|nr:SpoIIE family protein phosphatase [Crocinitomicaceae bacterium]
MYTSEDERIYIAAADCTGHGVPGAMVSVVCANALDRATKEFELPHTGEILDKVSELVVEQFEKSGEEVKDGMDIALCSLDPETLTVEFSGANNPLWLKRKHESIITSFRGDRQPIGNYHQSKPFSSQTIQCEKGDWIYIFSDGYADQFGGVNEKKFKSTKMKSLLLEISKLSAKEQEKRLILEFNNWKGELEQLDDVCVIGIKI